MTKRDVRQRVVRAGALLLIACLASTAACTRRPPPPPAVDNTPQVPAVSQSPYRYCVPAQTDLPTGGVQLLVDASGSMAGVAPGIGAAVDWLQRAIGRMNGTALMITSRRRCLFRHDTGAGLDSCGDATTPLGTLKPSGSTNIDEAIREAEKAPWDLTLILTDGVGAAGRTNSNCVSGTVDSACVGQMLGGFVKGQAGALRGVWLVPLVASHSGPFFAEVPAPRGWKATDVVETVKRDFSGAVSVSNPRQDGSQHLVFDYEGPRALLLVVLAKRVDGGRAMLQSLTATAGIPTPVQASGISDFTGQTAYLRPVELFPGYRPPVRLASIAPRPEPRAVAGPIQATLSGRDGGGTRLDVGCANAPAQGRYAIRLDASNPSDVGACVDFWSAPAFAPVLQPTAGPADRGFATIVTRWRENAASPGGPAQDLEIDIACPAGVPGYATEAVLGAMPSYRHSQACSTSGGCGGPWPLLQGLATTSPGMNPHRVFGLAGILDVFYQSVEGSAARVPLSTFTLSMTRAGAAPAPR